MGLEIEDSEASFRCDHCLNKVTDIDRARVVWISGDHGEGHRVKPLFICSTCDQRLRSGKESPVTSWRPLEVYLVQLGNNLNIDWALAHKKAQLQ